MIQQNYKGITISLKLDKNLTEVSQKNSNIFVILCSKENWVRLLYYCYRVPQFADSAIRGILAGYFNRELRDPPV